MAALARRQGVDVDVAAFETWDPAGRTFDAVVSGQSWHWIDPVAGAAKAAESLGTDGRLALFWNVLQPPAEPADRFSGVYRRVLPERSGYNWAAGWEAYSVMFGVAADGIRAPEAFSEPEQWRVDWQREYSRDEWLDQVPTFGGHGRLPATTLDELLAGIGTAIDGLGGSFTMSYATVAVTAERTAT